MAMLTNQKDVIYKIKTLKKTILQMNGSFKIILFADMRQTGKIAF
jgi:hypothetical protein